MDNYWKLLYKKDYSPSILPGFEKGKIYDVKDKFPGADGSFDNGYWEVKNGKGSLFNISAEDRFEHFVAMV